MDVFCGTILQFKEEGSEFISLNSRKIPETCSHFRAFIIFFMQVYRSQGKLYFIGAACIKADADIFLIFLTPCVFAVAGFYSFMLKGRGSGGVVQEGCRIPDPVRLKGNDVTLTQTTMMPSCWEPWHF